MINPYRVGDNGLGVLRRISLGQSCNVDVVGALRTRGRGLPVALRFSLPTYLESLSLIHCMLLGSYLSVVRAGAFWVNPKLMLSKVTAP